MTDAITFRRAVLADVSALHALVETAYRGDTARAGWTHEADLLGGQRTDPQALAEMLDDPSQTILLAETATGILAGCVSITRRGGGTAYLGLLTVAPARQAAGLGRRLLIEGERVAAALFGALRMEMTVISHRTELIDWYERRGYRQTDETRPFPVDQPRFGVPRRPDLEFVVLARALT